MDGNVRTIQSQNLDRPFRSSLKNGIERMAANDVPGRKSMVHAAIYKEISPRFIIKDIERLTVRMDRLSSFIDSDNLCAFVARTREILVSSWDACNIACIAAPFASMTRSLLS